MHMKFFEPVKVKIKDGSTVVIRNPKMSDAKELRDYINSLVEEDAPILMAKKMSLKDEKEWLGGILKKIKNGSGNYLVAEMDGRIVGGIDFRKEIGRSSHCASIGISVAKDYRRLGIATLLFKKIFEITKKDKSIKVIWLSLCEHNKKAYNLYKKMGFRPVARLKNRIQFKGKLVDEIVMDYKG